MIHELDESLRSFVRQEAFRTTGWTSCSTRRRRIGRVGATPPTVDLYLYDIREDIGAATRAATAFVGTPIDRHLTATSPPGGCEALSYLVTAWTQRPRGRAPPVVAPAAMLPSPATPSPGGAHGVARRTQLAISYTCCSTSRRGACPTCGPLWGVSSSHRSTWW